MWSRSKPTVYLWRYSQLTSGLVTGSSSTSRVCIMPNTRAWSVAGRMGSQSSVDTPIADAVGLKKGSTTMKRAPAFLACNKSYVGLPARLQAGLYAHKTMTCALTKSNRSRSEEHTSELQSRENL